MPLNYSKWDNLELSDDSDIEEHPNVDKRSMIRWKQRDIHEKREMRKQRIAQLKADIACNDVLHPRLVDIARAVASQGPAHFSVLVEKFKTNPSPEKPPTNAPTQQTYDEMLLSLMLQVWEEAKKAGVEKGDPELGEKLVEGVQRHVKLLEEHQVKLKTELATEEAEQKKKITSEDIHEGWESRYIPPKPEPAPIKNTIPDIKKKGIATEYEVLNPKGVSAASSSGTVDDDDDEEISGLPELTPSLEEFSKLPLRGYEQSWEFVKQHRDVIVPGAWDALLVAAFNAQSEGKETYAKQCVHQSLLLQYCDKLGKDGVSLFFRKMTSHDPRATVVFEKDVADTYAHLCERVRVAKAEEAKETETEQIQLVPENPNVQISFNVPDGPPPEKLVLEGPGTEHLDIEEVRKALQMRWDVFQSFSPKLRSALKSQDLDKVNKVLGAMKVADAEEVVKMLDMGGILNFAEHGVKDETGHGEGDTEEEDDEADDEGDEAAEEEEDEDEDEAAMSVDAIEDADDDEGQAKTKEASHSTT